MTTEILNGNENMLKDRIDALSIADVSDIKVIVLRKNMFLIMYN
jgi:hypothetical protein